MVRSRLVYRCDQCAAPHPKWSGRCTVCGEWNSLVEDLDLPVTETSAVHANIASGARPELIGAVDAEGGQPRASGIAEVDRVLGGGLVRGSVTLVGGEPGIGKSTLLLQLLASVGTRSLYVTAEESAQQVRLRAERLGAVGPDLWLLSELSLPHIVRAVDEISPEIVVIDSIQTVADPDLGSTPGSVVQVRGCAHRLVQEAKRRAMSVILVGHVTKEGGLAGPRVLEHVVDTVLSFEGDRHHALRLLRAVKHRFGPTSELGLFQMEERGLVGVPDASRLFLADRRTGVPGSAVVPTIEGHRPLLVEVQALTNSVSGGVPPRRSAQGVDAGRLSMLLAVLDRRARLSLADHEVYASAVGGIRLGEPAADLGVCLALASAAANVPLPADLVVCGEIGLAGEVRHVGHLQQRLAEAARLGFTRALVPSTTPDAPPGIDAQRVETLNDALSHVGLAAGG